MNGLPDFLPWIIEGHAFGLTMDVNLGCRLVNHGSFEGHAFGLTMDVNHGFEPGAMLWLTMDVNRGVIT
jgi:hypothetical protein